VGEHRAALAALQEAVDLWHDLATTEPAAHTPDLARNLGNLGSQLSDMGEHHAALASLQEAVDLCRDLATTEPAAHTPDLARNLGNLGNQLNAVGEHRAALASLQEAVDLWRRLATTEPAAHTPDLVRNLGNLALLLADAQRWNDEQQIRAEAAAWHARLTRLRPDDADARRAYNHARDNLAKHFSERGLTVYAAQAAEEAAAHRLPPDPPTTNPHKG
jgi:tetratricopeptide (TPR) repeat protein